MSKELNEHFIKITISSVENPVETLNSILTAPLEGFRLSEVSENKVILAVSHMRSQAEGENGTPQFVVAKALLAITPYLTRLFNA